MINQSVVLNKFQSMDKCLTRIEEVISGNIENFENIDKQDIFILNLQRASQLAIDVAAHIIKDENFPLPNHTRDYFTTLAEGKIVNNQLADKLGKMVGFRNLAIHNYQEIDVAILKSIYQNNLGDFEDFKKAVLAKFSS